MLKIKELENKSERNLVQNERTLFHSEASQISGGDSFLAEVLVMRQTQITGEPNITVVLGKHNTRNPMIYM